MLFTHGRRNRKGMINTKKGWCEMVAKKKKKSRQMKRAEARKKKGEMPQGAPMVKLELSLQEARIIVGGLSELPIKIALPVMNKVQMAMQAVLLIPPKQKGEADGGKA